MNKVRLTTLVREGGHRLGTAMDITGAVLAGREVSVHFSQFSAVAAARTALKKIGVREIVSA